MKIIKDVYYSNDQISAKTLDAYIPDGKTNAVFMYMHGGGLEKGDKSKRAEDIANFLEQEGIAFVSINYRMYPDAQYPDFILDAAQAVAWVNKNMQELFACDKLYVGGSSAGGYLSMMLCFDERYLANVGLDNSIIEGYFHDAGQPTAHFNVLKEFGEDSRRVIVDERAPMFHVGRAKDYSPMLFIVSDNDMFGRFEQTMLMVNVMKHFEHGDKVFLEVVNGTHCDYIYKTDESGEGKLAKMILSFIDKLDG